ncbi:hypothetical protein FHL15_008232 [Xylaria flabelliformis]|uniref:Uncharacterized protein n=1 Tax=Xylaria flabelliformis TaxID=2512241 RepID=A0A553HS97_9PEZI|nr:hypothetical protein FHL15_008232 [Xylaria flabelliformis]
MVLNSNLKPSLRGRRPITLSQELLANILQVGRVPHPIRRPGGNQSLSTNVTGNLPFTPLQHAPNTSTGVPRIQKRDAVTPSSLSVGIQSANQPSPVQIGHAGAVNSHLEPPQNNFTPISGQGPVAIGNQSGSYTQMTPYSSANPSIVVEPYDQQQALLGPSPLQSGRRQLALEPFNQYSFSTGYQRDNTQDQLLLGHQLLLLPDWDTFAIARVDMSMWNSYIYKEALPTLLDRADWERFIIPWPPNHTTLTTAGYDYNGGECIQLKLQNKGDPIVELPLAVVSRKEAQRAEIRGVDVVLCQSYFSALATRRNIPMGNEQQTGGIGYSNAGHQWSIPGQSQNAINSTANPGFGYDSPTWLLSGNQMEGNTSEPSTNPAYSQYRVFYKSKWLGSYCLFNH